MSVINDDVDISSTAHGAIYDDATLSVTVKSSSKSIPRRKNPRPLPAFHHVNFYNGTKLLFRKPVNNMSKPKISLKFGGATSISSSTNTPTSASTPTPGGGNKIKLTLGTGGSKTPTIKTEPTNEHLSLPPVKTKVGRPSKPSAKLIASKKRTADESEDEEAAQNGAITVDTAARAKKKVKISFSHTNTTPKTPTIIKSKYKGKPPKRPLGEGYDSEASDREQDPVIEEEWILRMLPGDDCDYLRQMINERRIGTPKSQGGADVHFKFFHNEGRRAAITIRGRCYAATMVDLPCIIEGMKSWDKKGWYKSADICQMLLVFAPIAKEIDAETVELPKMIDPSTFQYPHGLTVPMRNARKNRFRKRIRKEAIEAVEDAVEKLLAADSEAATSRYEMVEPETASRQASYSSPAPYGQEDDGFGDEDADAEGEIDDEGGYFDQSNATMADAAIDDIDLEAELEREFELEIGTPNSTTILDNPATMDNSAVRQEEDSGDESVEDDDDDPDDGDSDDDMDEDEKARNAELAGAREDIREMEKQLESLQTGYLSQMNPILKARIKSNIEKVKGELQLKKAAIGEGDED